MTEPFDEYGDRLRRVLHTEADAVTPSPEGLEQIRARIDHRRERRFGLWYSAPWLRPLAAVGAAMFISLVAVSATPALKNFVQSGHLSSDDRGGDDRQVTGGTSSRNQGVPGGPISSGASATPRPRTASTKIPGKHVVTGTCPPGEGTVTPTTGSRTVTEGPTPRITCQPSAPPTAPPTEVPTVTPSHTPDPPESPPASGESTAASEPSGQATF